MEKLLTKYIDFLIDEEGDLGMKEIVCILNQIDEKTDIEVACLHIGFSKNNQRIEKFNINLLDNLEQITLEQLDEVANQINEKFVKAKGINLNFGINIHQTFMEHFEFPKLSNSILEKSLVLEMNKLYNDFEQKYVTSMVNYMSNQKTIKIDILFCEKKIYSKIIYFINKLHFRLKKIYFVPSSLRNIVNKNNLLTNQKNILLNITNEYTYVLFINTIYLEKVQTYKLTLSDFFMADEEDNINKNLKNTLQIVLDDIKHSFANSIEDKNINPNYNIYINLEDECYKNIIDFYVGELKLNDININISIRNNLLLFAGLDKLDPTLDFVFPFKVKL